MVYDFDGDGVVDSPIDAAGNPASSWAFGLFRPRHHGGNSLVGNMDERGANFAFIDTRVEYRTMRQYLENFQNMWLP